MAISELIDRVVALLKAAAIKGIKQASEIDQCIAELQKLKGWAYPALTTEDIVKVVRCKHCRHYKRYKKKDDRKSLPFYACSLTKIRRDPEFYCGDGREKD